ncbi:MAG: hypothetical protein AAF414_04080 [Pseudomonadota bacterium]
MSEFFQSPLGMHVAFVVIALPALLLIYRRAGLAPWGALLVVVPVVGFALGLAALVGQRWPAMPARPGGEKVRR